MKKKTEIEQKPLVSVIIPTFNRSHLIKATLNSIINQTYTNWKCLIIDDGSTDDTEKVIFSFLKKDNRFNYFKRPKNLKKGPSSCRNFGIRESKGDFIQFFDDDDIMYEDMLASKIKFLENKTIDVVVSPMNFNDFYKNKIIKTNNVRSKNLIKDYVSGKISWYVSGPMWRRKFLKENFDKNIQTLDDWDFNLRNIYNCPQIYFIDKPLQDYNIYKINETLTGQSILGDIVQIESIFLTYKKHIHLLKNKNKLSFEVNEILFKRLVFLLRQTLSLKCKDQSRNIFNFLKKNIPLGYNLKFLKIIIGYYSYKIFNKGYRFVNV